MTNLNELPSHDQLQVGGFDETLKKANKLVYEQSQPVKKQRREKEIKKNREYL